MVQEPFRFRLSGLYTVYFRGRYPLLLNWSPLARLFSGEAALVQRKTATTLFLLSPVGTGCAEIFEGGVKFPPLVELYHLHTKGIFAFSHNGYA